MDFLTILSVIKNFGPRKYLYLGIGLASIITFGYLGLTYHSAISNANIAKSQVIEMKDQISEMKDTVNSQNIAINNLKDYVEFKDETIHILKQQIETLGKREVEAEKNRKESLRKFEEIMLKYNESEDSNMSPKLVNILNGLEGAGHE